MKTIIIQHFNLVNMQAIFKTYDVDNDGFIDLQNLKQSMDR